MYRMLDELTSREVAGWMAYWEMEPFGPQVESFGHAQTAAVIANANRDKKSKSVSYEDFMPRFEAREKEATSNDVFGTVKRYAQAAGLLVTRS